MILRIRTDPWKLFDIETVIIDNSEEIIREIYSLTAGSNQLDTCLT